MAKHRDVSVNRTGRVLKPHRSPHGRDNHDPQDDDTADSPEEQRQKGPGKRIPMVAPRGMTDEDEDEDEDEELEQDDERDWEGDDDLREEDEDEDDAPEREDDGSAKIVRKDLVVHPLQSCAWRRRRGVYIPDWALAITAKDDEQKLLGSLDYWLGVRQDRRIRAPLHRLHQDARSGLISYICTARQIGRHIGKNKSQVHGLIRRLKTKGFLVVAKHAKGKRVMALRLRLDWERIESEFKSVPIGEDEE